MNAFLLIVFLLISGFVIWKLTDPDKIETADQVQSKTVDQVQSKTTAPAQSKTVNLDAESEKIKSDFNQVMGYLLSLVIIQGIGFSAGIGKVLQDYFGVSRATSFLVVFLLSLPLILLLRGMQIMTNAILLNKANK